MLPLFALPLGFAPAGPLSRLAVRPTTRAAALMAEPRVFELKLPLGEAGTANLRFKAREPASESVVVRYAIPFGLNVENQGSDKPGLCRAVCTKDGAGGEKVGDVLRYCTEYKMQLAGGGGGGIITTVASFGGALSYKIGLFDVAKAKSWDDVVEALTSNTPERTDE